MAHKSKKKKSKATGPEPKPKAKAKAKDAEGKAGEGGVRGVCTIWKRILRNVFIRMKNTNERYSQGNFSELTGLNATTISRYMSNSDMTRPLFGEHARLILQNAPLTAVERREFIKSYNTQAKPDERISAVGLAVPEERLATKEEKELRNKIRKAKSLIDLVETGDFENQTIIVTTAMEGATVFRGALSSVETFIKSKKAQFFIMTSKAHLAPLSDDEYPLDSVLLEKYADNVRRGIEVNSHLHIRNVDIRPYVSDPIQGRAELGAETGRSYIFAHQQQRMKPLPNGINALPRIQWTTGSLTHPLYRDNGSGMLADQRHVMGALIVEVRKDKFWIRDVQFDADGSFVDLGVRYCPDGKERWAGRALYINRGDDHVGFQDTGATASEDEAASMMEVEKIFIQDIGDCASVSHHRDKSVKARLRLPAAVKDLPTELASISSFLDHLNAVKPQDCQLYVVPSNHPEHLVRYIDENRFAKCSNMVNNYEKAVELALQYQVNDVDPFIWGVDPVAAHDELRERLMKKVERGETLSETQRMMLIELIGSQNKKTPKAIWLKRSDATFRVGGVAIHHGDKGLNGAKGNVKGDCISYGKSSGGHSHTPENWRGARRVGTSTELALDYTIGAPSSWAHCFELAFRTVTGDENECLRQSVFSIDGEWTMDKKGLAAKIKKLKEEALKEDADAANVKVA